MFNQDFKSMARSQHCPEEDLARIAAPSLARVFPALSRHAAAAVLVFLAAAAGAGLIAADLWH